MHTCQVSALVFVGSHWICMQSPPTYQSYQMRVGHIATYNSALSAKLFFNSMLHIPLVCSCQIGHSVLLEDIIHRTEIISVWPEKKEEFSVGDYFNTNFFFSGIFFNKWTSFEFISSYRNPSPLSIHISCFLSVSVDGNFLLFSGFPGFALST